jgi:hypothetical protein
MVDNLNGKMNFVKACFDTVYFLNEDKRQDQLDKLLKGKSIKKRKPLRKIFPNTPKKDDNPFKGNNLNSKQRWDNPFIEAKYMKINQSIKISSCRGSIAL